MSGLLWRGSLVDSAPFPDAAVRVVGRGLVRDRNLINGFDRAIYIAVFGKCIRIKAAPLHKKYLVLRHLTDSADLALITKPLP